ncbi:MAG: PD-(D/E)XK nuclease family protein [Planctomycetota bacterium]|nr:PD-(D/E)XK nuclease family protein [Planctomycetota bacterium]
MNHCFLGTDSDVLKSSAKKLLAIDAGGLPEDSGGRPFDLRECLVLVPGRQAGRRLRRLLVEQAAIGHRGLLPPRITTPGHLEETLCAPQNPFVSGIEDRIAWIDSLRSCSKDLLAPLGIDPDSTGVQALLPLARLFSRLSSDLRREGLTLAVAAEKASHHDPDAALRLRAVERIEALRSAQIRALGLTDSGTFSIAPELSQPRVILIGILELPAQMRLWLDQYCQAEAWIDADESRAHLYDEYGIPIPEAWENLPFSGPIEWVVADDPRSLTAALLQQIDQHAASSRCDDVTIGLVDQELSPWLLDGFRRAQIPLHIAAGTPHSSTSCGRLLADLRLAVETFSSHSMAALARHPAIHPRLPRQTDRHGRELDPLESIDRWSTARQPVMATDPLAPAAVEFIRQAIEPLRKTQETHIDWVQPLLDAITALVGANNQQQPLLPRSGLDGLISAVQKLSQIENHQAQPLSILDAISLLIDLLEDSPVSDQQGSSAIGLLGWLELPFDPARLLLLTGPTEGQLSPAPSGDPLLPHGVREQLGMAGPAQRHARDAHILHSLLDDRRKTVVATCARNGDGNPLLPSRLFLQGPAGLERLAHFLDRQRRQRFHLPESNPPASSPVSLGAPKGVILPPPESIAITALADYLEDPVLFQMNRVLRLRDCHDRDRQLNPLAFGNLIHKVLEQFGQDLKLRELTDEGQIRDALHQLLDRYRRERIADPARAAVLVQLEQAKVRLDAWATVQASQRAQGWRLVAAEVDLDPQRCRIAVAEGEMGLSGRIDRIDYHEQDQRWRLLDYKTGESGIPPEKDHRRGRSKDQKTWVRLQLPLYRHFAGQLEIDGRQVDSAAEIGFFLLPASPGKTRIEIARWDEDELADAYQCCCKAVSGILTGCEDPLTVLKTPWQRALAGVVVESAARLDGIHSSDEEEQE